ncbi:MAG TPA: GNAT family N-acetyltransferase [Acidimicrobiales bacterium]|nr:GNAT family N-acetyltransferase [Acidimicrobiales bacterium]
MDAAIRAPETDDEWREVHDLWSRAFSTRIDHAKREEWLTKVDRSRGLAAYVGSDLAAAAFVRPFGQYFGGRAVPMGGFSPVAVAPEHRGRGLGSRITAAHYPSMRERGEAIATLYPASTQLYRGVGFGLGGEYAHQRIASRDLQRLRRPTGLAVRRLGEADLGSVKRCYAANAAARDGWVDRPEVWWDRVFESIAEQHLYGIEAEDGQALSGYVRYVHRPTKPPFNYTIEVQELCALDTDVLVTLWHLVASSSTQAPSVTWIAPHDNELLHLLPDQDFEPTGEIRWMVRLVDAHAAMAARGFPEAVAASVDLDLPDKYCEWNAGRWRLTIEGGRGVLQRGGEGTVSVGPPALASLFTGYAGAEVLRRAGLLASSDDRAVAALSAAFAGPTPWCADFF